MVCTSTHTWACDTAALSRSVFGFPLLFPALRCEGDETTRHKKSAASKDFLFFFSFSFERMARLQSFDRSQSWRLRDDAVFTIGAAKVPQTAHATVLTCS